MRLALEPEPFCFLETTDETVEYFNKHLYAGAAVEKCYEDCGASRIAEEFADCGEAIGGAASGSAISRRPEAWMASCTRSRKASM